MFKKSFVGRFLVFLLAITFVFGLFANQAPRAKAFSNLDQWFSVYNSYYYIQWNQWIGQSFKPTYNKLDGLAIYGGIYNSPSAPASTNITAYVYKQTPMTLLGSKSFTITKTQKWYAFDIGPFDTVAENSYIVYLFATSGYAYWRVNTGGGYSRGNAIVMSVADPNKDFLFGTYGYNYTPPPEPGPAPEEPSGDSQAAVADPGTSSNAPAAQPSTEIAAPTNLKAKLNTDEKGNSISLTWTASQTTDISGYKIFRSTDEKTGFVEIGDVGKKTLSYQDEKAIVGIKHYYTVRAYKEKIQSKDSNVASATLTDTTAPATPKNFKISSRNKDEIRFSWDKNTEVDLSNYILTIAFGSGQDEKALVTVDTIGKDDATYTLKLADNQILAKDKEYVFYLQAKDISNNFSEKASTKGQFSSAKKPLWFWLAIAGGVLVLAGATVGLILFIRRRRRMKGIK